MDDLSKKITVNANVKTATVYSAKIGVLRMIEILLETSATIPSRTQLITNIPIGIPTNNGVSGTFINQSSLSNTCFYIDNYPKVNGGVSLVSTASIPAGSYRGSIVLITK